MKYIVYWVEFNIVEPDTLKYVLIYMPEINEVNWSFTVRKEYQ